MYDQAFKQNLKKIIAHEFAHLFYQKLSLEQITRFMDSSGWELEYKDSKLFLKPPKVPILEDSIVDREEDFSNYVEIFISEPDKLKKINPKMFDFISKELSQ